MAKRKQTLEINGEYFTLENKLASKNHYSSFKTLDMCYDRPSYAKQRIYDYWYNWFNELGSPYLEHGIESYNCMQFTYGGYITFEGVEYYAYITKAYNRLYRVEDGDPCTITADGEKVVLS